MLPEHKTKLLPSIFNRDFPDFLFRFPVISDFEGYLKPTERGDQGLNVYEENNDFIIEAALPGLKNEEIDINLRKGVLWIKGEKKQEESDKDKKYYRKSFCTYSYSVALPDQIDDNQEPEASYDNGVLKVVFRKAKSAEAKKISIKNEKKK